MNIETMFERPDVRQLVHAFLLLDGEADVRAFLTDLCTRAKSATLPSVCRWHVTLTRANLMLRYRHEPVPRQLRSAVFPKRSMVSTVGIAVC